MSIFVSIASFCDPLLEFTLDGLFEQADRPGELSVAIIDQSPPGNRERFEAKPYWSQLRYLQIDPTDSRGPSWARNIAFSLYRGEDYLLQVDSHTLVDKGWDTSLIGSIERLKRLSAKSIITTYPPPFTLDVEGKAERTVFEGNFIHELAPSDEAKLTEESATLLFDTRRNVEQEFMEGYHIAAGFFFAQGSFVDEIPYDPYMYFHGEEQNLAVRAYTSGWSIFYPRQDLIPVYHLYKQADQAHRTHHWHEDHEVKRTVKWHELHARSEARLRDLVYGEKKGGAYGLGSERSLRDFARLSGIDYARRTMACKRIVWTPEAAAVPAYTPETGAAEADTSSQPA